MTSEKILKMRPLLEAVSLQSIVIVVRGQKVISSNKRYTGHKPQRESFSIRQIMMVSNLVENTWKQNNEHENL